MNKEQYDPGKPLSAQISGDALDDTVHEEASRMASNINNGGLSEQIEFLSVTRGWSDEDIFNAAHNIDSDEDEPVIPEMTVEQADPSDPEGDPPAEGKTYIRFVVGGCKCDWHEVAFRQGSYNYLRREDDGIPTTRVHDEDVMDRKVIP